MVDIRKQEISSVSGRTINSNTVPHPTHVYYKQLVPHKANFQVQNGVVYAPSSITTGTQPEEWCQVC